MLDVTPNWRISEGDELDITGDVLRVVALVCAQVSLTDRSPMEESERQFGPVAVKYDVGRVCIFGGDGVFTTVKDDAFDVGNEESWTSLDSSTAGAWVLSGDVLSVETCRATRR